MGELGFVAQIGELLALCGITSVRCFMPTFVVCALCRWGIPPFGWQTEALTALANQIPDAMLSNGGLFVLGCMALLELSANWNQSVRALFADVNWERFLKPAYAFVFAMVVGASDGAAPVVASVGDAVSQVAPAVSNAVAQVAPAVSNTVAQAVSPDVVPSSGGVSFWSWLWSLIPAGLAAFGTNLLCAFKSRVAEAIRSLDPDNSFKLQSFACAVEESAWVIFVLIAVLVPFLAIFFMVLVSALGYFAMQAMKSIEDKHSHDCPHCAGRVHNSALKCPNCRADQPAPYYAVGFRGLAAQQTVDATQPAAVHAHHLKLLMEHRCPICAMPLTDHQTCSHCGVAIWEQGVTREELVKILDMRMIGGLVGGCVVSVVPILGFVATIVYLNNWCLRIFRAYESRGSLFLTRLVFRLAKWTVLIFCCIFSAFPLAGILFMAPYGYSYWRSRTRFLK